MKRLFAAVLVSFGFLSATEANWTYLGLGGSYTTSLSLHDEYIYVTADDGFYRKLILDSDTTWTELGWQGIKTGPHLVLSPDTILLGIPTDTIAIYRTTDAGNSWEPFDNDFGKSHLSQLTNIDQGFDSSHFIIASSDRTIHRSMDGGQNWRHVWPDTTQIALPEYPQFVHIHQFLPNIIWVGGTSGVGRVWVDYSDDGGNTWVDATSQLGGPGVCFDVAPHPTHPDSAWATVGEPYRTGNAGTDWDIAELAYIDHMVQIIVDPIHTNRVYGVGWAQNGPATISISTDGGATFYSEASNPGSAFPEDLQMLQYDSSNVLYVATRNGVFSIIDDQVSCGSTDYDSDGHFDLCDNCIKVANPDQGITITMTGDVNQDGALTSADIIGIVNHIFKAGTPPQPCRAAGDVNCSGNVSGGDVIKMVGHVFKGDTPPCDVCSAPLQWSCP